MTLLSAADHHRWAAAVTAVAGPVPLRHLALDGDADPGPTWRQLVGLTDGGALLVRPDQHLAWRATAAEADGGALAGALAEVLGLPA